MRRCFYLLFGVCLLYVMFNKHTPSYFNNPNYSIHDEKLKEGDIIMRRGHGIISSIIANTLQDSLKLSHCGILIKVNNHWKVVHSIAKELSDKEGGIQCCNLDDFIAGGVDSSVIITRCKKDSAGIILAREAKYYLAQHIPFDYHFSLKDTTSFFCLQLPIHILKHECGINLATTNNIPPFSIFTDTTYFSIIIAGVIQHKKTYGHFTQNIRTFS